MPVRPASARAFSAWMPAVRRGEDRIVGRHHGGRRIGEVAQDGEVDVRIAVAQRQHLEVLDQLGDPAHAREQRRDHDHGAMLRGHAAHEIDARQPARGPDARREPLHDGDGEFRCRQQEEQRRDTFPPDVTADAAHVGDGARRGAAR